MNDLREVALGRNGKLSFICLHPRVEPIDEHHSPGRRGGRSQEQGMIAPRANATDRATGKSPEAIGFEPLRVRITAGIHRSLYSTEAAPQTERGFSATDDHRLNTDGTRG